MLEVQMKTPLFLSINAHLQTSINLKKNFVYIDIIYAGSANENPILFLSNNAYVQTSVNLE